MKQIKISNIQNLVFKDKRTGEEVLTIPFDSQIQNSKDEYEKILKDDYKVIGERK